MVWKPDYVTQAELKDYLQVESADDDAFVALWATAASRNVDDFCGRQFGKSDAMVTRRARRRVRDSAAGRYVYVVDDLYALDDLVITDGDTVITDYDTEPVNAIADGVPVQRILVDACADLEFTSAKWGWPAVPASIKVGLQLMAGRLAARRGAPFGIAGSPSDGSEMRLLAKLDPDMLVVLKPYRRGWWAA